MPTGTASGPEASCPLRPCARCTAGAIVLFNGEYFDSTRLAIDLAEIARAAVLTQVPETGVANQATPGTVLPLLGLYARPGLTYVVQVQWRDGRLAVAGPAQDGWRLPLSPTTDPDIFATDLDSPQAGGQVRFHRGPDGRISAISLFDATFDRLDPVRLASRGLCRGLVPPGAGQRWHGIW
jgi:hypothetical protein